MFTISNLIKCLVICSLVAAGFVFYFSSSAFVESVGIHGNLEIGRIQAFVEASKTIDYFWPHLFRGWLDSFVMLFIGCALLLAVVQPPNKARHEMDGSVEPPIR